MTADPLTLNRLGREALSRGDGPTALRLLSEADAADPGKPALLFNLSAAHRACGDRAAALRVLQGALAIDPDFVQAMFQMGILYEELDDRGSAVAVFRNFLDTIPAAVRADPRFDRPIRHARDAVAVDDADLADKLAPVFEGASVRVRESLGALLGRDRIYTSEPTFLTIPRLPAIPFLDRADTPWLDAVEARTPDMIAEARRALDEAVDDFRPYVANPAGTQLNQWKDLDHSPDWEALFFWKHGQRFADAHAAFPATSAALDLVPLLDLDGRGPNAFFSKLRPGTRIPPHTGVTNARVTVHVPLIVPERCGFRVGAERRKWVSGQAWVFDDTIEHEAWNESDEPRLILIFDVWHPAMSVDEREAVARTLDIYAAHRAGGSRAGEGW